jgi:hypothetical protein
MSVMASNATTLRNVQEKIAHCWTRHRVRIIAHLVLIAAVVGMVVSLPVATEAARRDRYAVEYELAHLPPELPVLPHSIDIDADVSSHVLEEIKTIACKDSQANLDDVQVRDSLASRLKATEKGEEEKSFSIEILTR